MTMTPQLGAYIRRCRQAAGLTPADLAVRIGKSVTQISRWELGRQRPVDEDVRRLIEILGMDPQEFWRLLTEPWGGAPTVADIEEAITANRELLPEAKHHLINQMRLLLRVQVPVGAAAPRRRRSDDNGDDR